MRRPLALFVLSAAAAAQGPGYTDTPMLPDGQFRVHDATRPHPPIVDPGPVPPMRAAPADAIVLFDGTDLGAFAGSDGGAARWTVANGCATANKTGDIHTVREFGDCQLHVEWATPAEVDEDSQGRGNSGVFLMDRYEVQVLDSFDNVTYADGQAAALYGQFPPLVNCCRRPGEWQSYDIAFVAPRFDKDGKLRSPARVTVWHNGIVVQLDRPLWGATAHRSLPQYRAHGRAPIRLQDHGNPVRYRNIWVREVDFAAAAVPAPTLPAAAAPAGGHDK